MEWDVGGEIYWRKIEVFCGKVGSGYFSVFSEEGGYFISFLLDYYELVDFGVVLFYLIIFWVVSV